MWQCSYITLSGCHTCCIGRQKVAGVDGHFGLEPNLRPHLLGSDAVLRWKEGQPLPPTAAVASSGDAKDVAVLFHHTFRLPYVALGGRRSLELMAILDLSPI